MREYATSIPVTTGQPASRKSAHRCPSPQPMSAALSPTRPTAGTCRASRNLPRNLPEAIRAVSRHRRGCRFNRVLIVRRVEGLALAVTRQRRRIDAVCFASATQEGKPGGAETYPPVISPTPAGQVVSEKRIGCRHRRRGHQELATRRPMMSHMAPNRPIIRLRPKRPLPGRNRSRASSSVSTIHA